MLGVIKREDKMNDTITDFSKCDRDFKVEKAKVATKSENFELRWIITKNGIPEYQVNDFIEDKSTKKISTGKTYAFSLVKFLNFLAKRGVNYSECTQFLAKQYVNYLIYGEMEDLRVIDASQRVTYSTVSKDITVMTEFFKYLRDEENEMLMTLKDKKMTNKKAFLYGQIFEFNYSKILDKNLGSLNIGRSYIKWYSEEQIKAISSNFSGLRDKAIFLLTVEGGMRIDEVLSLKLDSIDHSEQIVQPTRSKRKKDGSDEIRLVALTNETYKLLNDYIDTERAIAESESGMFIDEVFINLRKGETQGFPLKYHNILKIIKRAAMKAGLDSKEIRTHSGRSTKVDELLMHQVQYPEDNLTDEIIRQMMGWSDGNSIEPYKNRGNKVIAKSAAEKVSRRKGNVKKR